jgi:hypothetical protein
MEFNPVVKIYLLPLLRERVGVRAKILYSPLASLLLKSPWYNNANKEHCF